MTESTMAPTVIAKASMFSILNPPPRCTGALLEPGKKAPTYDAQAMSVTYISIREGVFIFPFF
jgi:hypothetical protein